MVQWNLLPDSSVKNLLANTGDLDLIPESGRSLEKEMAIHTSILAWEIPWIEEPGGLQSTGLHKSHITQQLNNNTSEDQGNKESLPKSEILHKS